VATSRRHLRLFSPAGSQTHLLTLPGAPVALAASGHALAAAWHAGPPASSGDQCLRYALYDVAEQRQLHAGPLPLSPGATLAWLGFTEEGQLASYDSHGELRLRSADFGGTWVTAFSATAGAGGVGVGVRVGGVCEGGGCAHAAAGLRLLPDLAACQPSRTSSMAADCHGIGPLMNPPPASAWLGFP
jgi:hypothetical protein